MSAVDHLEELRTRLIVSLLAVGIAFGFCFWQNHELLKLVNAPLAHNTQQQVRAGRDRSAPHTPSSERRATSHASSGPWPGRCAASPARRPSRLSSPGSSRTSTATCSACQRAPRGDRPVTLGIGEPFTSTLTVTLIFALILALPVLLLQAYGFLMPAFEPVQRRRMLPVTLAIPLLFAVGVTFGYLVVLPASLHFFQNFNAGQFNVLVQAGPYYRFAATIMLAMGLLFQVPVAIIAVTRAGVITPRQLRRHRRWAVAGLLRGRGDHPRRRHHDAARDACRCTCCSRSACWSPPCPSVAARSGPAPPSRR